MAFKWINKFFLGKVDFNKCVNRAAYYYGKSISLQTEEEIANGRIDYSYRGE